MNSNTLNITIEVDDNGTPKIKKLAKEMGSAAKTGEQGFKRTNKTLGDFNGVASTASKLVADLDDSMNLAIPSLTTIASIGFKTTIAGLTALGAAGAALITSAANQAKEIKNLSSLANMGTEDFQNFAYATQSVGVNSEKLADISKDVQDKLGDFIATGGGEFKDFFEQVAPKVGLTADALQGLSGPDVLIAVKDAMDAANVSAEEQVFYLESLANDASLLTPLLQDNGAALKEQAAQADALGIAISEIESENLLEAGAAIKQLTGLFGALKNKVAAELSPIFTDFANNIVNGMTSGAGGVDTLATSLSVKLLQSLGGVIETMRFFHNGWLGIKLVGTLAIDAIAVSLEKLFGGLRTLMTPLDLLFEGAVKLGAIDVNPFDGVEEALGIFSASSRDVTNSVLADIEKTNAGYDKAKAVITGYVGMVKDSAASDQAAAHWRQAADVAGLAAAEQKSLLNDVVAETGNTSSQIIKIKTDERYQALQLSKDAHEETLKLLEEECREEEKLAAARATAYREMYDDIEHSATEHFDHQLQSLNKQKEEYETLKLDQNITDEWYTQRYKDLEDEKLAKTGDFVDGVRLGWEQMQRDQLTWAEAGRSIFETWTADVTTTLSDSLFAVIKGDFDDMGERWSSLWDSMLQKFTDVIAQMAVTWAVSEIGNMFEGWDIFHSGIWEIKEDEVPAIVQKGEMIIPKEEAKFLRDHVGTQSFEGLLEAVSKPGLPDFSDKFLGHLSEAYVEDALKGLVGMLTGVIGPGQFFDFMMSPNVAVGNTSMALTRTGMNAFGLAGRWTEGGMRFGSMLSMSALGFTGPAAALVGALGGFLGAHIGDIIGDGLDAREFEGFRDAFENGTLAQKRAIAEFVNEMGEFGITNADELGAVLDSFYGYDTITQQYEDLNDMTLPPDSDIQFGDDLGPKGTYDSTGGVPADPSDYDTDYGGDYDGSDSDRDYNSGTGDRDYDGSSSDGIGGYRYGGISYGPESGHWELLHGVEAVVPLKDGAIPVDLSGGYFPILELMRADQYGSADLTGQDSFRKIIARLDRLEREVSRPIVVQAKLKAYIGDKEIKETMRLEAEDVYIEKGNQRGAGRLRYAAA